MLATRDAHLRFQNWAQAEGFKTEKIPAINGFVQRVQAQVGGAHIHALVAQAARHLQLLGFVQQAQAVAAFDLDGGHAVGLELVQAAAGQLEQLPLRAAAGGGHGAGDAAAGVGDLGVAVAGQAHLELVGAGAAVHQVRVAINQAGRDPGVVQVHFLAHPCRPLGRQRRQRADPGELVALHHQAGVVDGAPGTAVCQRGRAQVPPQGDGRIQGIGHQATTFPCST